MTELLLDAAGRRRSPAATPGFHVASIYLQAIDNAEIIDTVHAEHR